ncbi:glycosyltransferase family 4 protein [Haloarcula laminariae]|uniref:glycosyltransferase family 4 protein n=1 Tax=Haloarcula laminariae TaxID=2961577 RepID=UPI0021C88D89|nr:glycosyltransferase family 4 protein [Halomicroarcula laminariae]
MTTFDISTAPGTTEAYYLVQKFAENWDTHVFAPLEGPIESVHRHCLPLASLGAVLMFNTVLTPWFVWLALRRPPDVVIIYKNIFVPALVVRLCTDAVVVYDIRADPYEQAKEFAEFDPQGLLYHAFLRVGRQLHQITLPRADGVVTLSDPLAERLQTDYGVPEEKIGLVPLAADPDAFTPASGNMDRVRIAYVGSLTKYRGLDNVVRALAALKPELRSQVRLDLYGGADKELIDSLEALAPDGPAIEWHGYLDHDELSDEVAACDIAVSPLPPLASFEVSSPAKVYEYLALGLPVVATDITPHRRILDEGCAILVPSRDVDSMTDAFARLVGDEAYRSQLSAGAREQALENTWADRFETLCTHIDCWSSATGRGVAAGN